MVENQRAKSLPKEITAPGEGGSVNGSPTDSRRKKSLITMDHISEIEDVSFQHITHKVETLARFLVSGEET